MPVILRSRVLRLNSKYLEALQATFLISLCLFPLATSLVTKAATAHMPYTITLTVSDILKALFLATTVICMAVSLALIVQYHHIAKLSTYQIHCTTSESQTTEQQPPIPAASTTPEISRNTTKPPGQLLSLLQDTPMVTNPRRNSVD